MLLVYVAYGVVIVFVIPVWGYLPTRMSKLTRICLNPRRHDGSPSTSRIAKKVLSLPVNLLLGSFTWTKDVVFGTVDGIGSISNTIRSNSEEESEKIADTPEISTSSDESPTFVESIGKKIQETRDAKKDSQELAKIVEETPYKVARECLRGASGIIQGIYKIKDDVDSIISEPELSKKIIPTVPKQKNGSVEDKALGTWTAAKETTYAVIDTTNYVAESLVSVGKTIVDTVKAVPSAIESITDTPMKISKAKEDVERRLEETVTSIQDLGQATYQVATLEEPRKIAKRTILSVSGIVRKAQWFISPGQAPPREAEQKKRTDPLVQQGFSRNNEASALIKRGFSAVQNAQGLYLRIADAMDKTKLEESAPQNTLILQGGKWVEKPEIWPQHTSLRM